MSDFFHGWRRKLGCLLLAMALGAFSTWMRSMVRCDEVDFRWFGGYHALIAERGKLFWATEPGSKVYVRHGVSHYSASRSGDVVDRLLSSEDWDIARLRNEIAGVEFGYLETSNGLFGSSKKLRWCRVRFLVIVLILTLPAAYLILVPRKRPILLRQQPGS